MGKSRLILILSSTLSILLFGYSAAFANFSEDFNDETLDANKWTVNTNGGTVSVDSGILQINSQTSNTYPYIHTNNIVFGDEFVAEIRLKISGPLNYGSGVNFADSLLTNHIPDSLGWDDLVYLFWPDGAGHFKLNTIMCPETSVGCSPDQYNGALSSDNLGDWVVYRIEQDNNFSIIYRNNVLVNKLLVNTRKPQYIWIGNPQTTSTVTRGKIEIDYISISSLVTESNVIPILLIPGFGASWNYQSILTNSAGGEWTIPSWINTYDNLINSIQNAGYQRDHNLFVYAYDWRKPLDQQADALNIYLQNLESQNKITSGTKINFVAHSFGGLVARTYLDKYGTGHLGKLVTVGSPHQGTPDAYKAWSGGQITLGNWWQKVALSLLVDLNLINGETPVSAIRRLSPSIKDVLPTYDFLIDSDSVPKPIGNMSVINDSLNVLNLHISSIDASTSAITGNNNPTLDKIGYVSRSWLDQLLGKWDDGRPEIDMTTPLGDGAITGQSAKGSFSDFMVTDFNHGDLVFDGAGIASIFQKLNLDVSKIVTTASAQVGTDPIVAILRSPGNLKLQTPTGGLVGMGEPGTISAIVIPQQKIVIIPDPQSGDYQVKVTPDGTTGDYSLYAGRSNSLGLSLKRISAVLSTGDTDTFLLSQNSELQSLDPTNDPDFEEVILEINSRINPDLESNFGNKNRLQNLKIYMNNTFENYSTKSQIIQRNLILSVLDQIQSLQKTTNFAENNQMFIIDLLHLLQVESLKKVVTEQIDIDLYDLIYVKNATNEAKFQTNLISTASAIQFEPIGNLLTPLSSQSANLPLDLTKMFLKSIFLN